jgi:DNA modification methylase
VGKLYFGDNLGILRALDSHSVDLVYLDPPFNSKALYNTIFKGPDGVTPVSQVAAFKDTWSWGDEARTCYEGVLGVGGEAATVLKALMSILGRSDMMAYIAMMAARLEVLHRVLKPSGSLYLHCDPSAAHYLKIVLDGIFGRSNFRNEISWRRQNAHNDTKQGRRQYGNVRDVIFFYTTSDAWTWNPQYTSYDPDYIAKSYRHIEAQSGRRFTLSDMTGPGGAAKGNPEYEVMGVTRHWRYSRAEMGRLITEGRVHQSRPGKVPRQKRYLDEMPGVALQNDWGDIRPAAKRERVGYPTQKPLALMERILSASSNPGDVVLDPFCGCGTTVHAAQRLERDWIGIDITHYAVTVIEERLKRECNLNRVEVIGRPTTLEEARVLADKWPYQFQYWANWLIGARAYKETKGADGGIDGLFHFPNGGRDGLVLSSVKGGRNVGPEAVRSLIGVVEGAQADLGVLVVLEKITKAMRDTAESAGYVRTPMVKRPRVQILTVEDLLKGNKPDLPEPYPSLTGAVGFHAKAARAPDPQLTLPLLFHGAAGGRSKEGQFFIDPRAVYAT